MATVISSRPRGSQPSSSVARAWETSWRSPSSGTATVRLVVQDDAGKKVTRSSTLPVATNAWHTVRVRALGLRPGTYTALFYAIDRAGNMQDGITETRLVLR